MTGNGKKRTAEQAVAAFVQTAVELQAAQAAQIAELQAQLDAAKFVIDLQAAEISGLLSKLDAADFVIYLLVQTQRVS